MTPDFLDCHVAGTRRKDEMSMTGLFVISGNPREGIVLKLSRF
jgi:hypothetical protein